MDKIKVTIGNTEDPSIPEVAAAVAAVRARLGDDYTFEVLLDSQGVWSREEFNTFLPQDWDFDAPGYHPHGRSGQLAQIVADQTGGRAVCPELPAPSEDAVP